MGFYEIEIKKTGGTLGPRDPMAFKVYAENVVSALKKVSMEIQSTALKNLEHPKKEGKNEKKD